MKYFNMCAVEQDSQGGIQSHLQEVKTETSVFTLQKLRLEPEFQSDALTTESLDLWHFRAEDKWYSKVIQTRDQRVLDN